MWAQITMTYGMGFLNYNDVYSVMRINNVILVGLLVGTLVFMAAQTADAQVSCGGAQVSAPTGVRVMDSYKESYLGKVQWNAVSPSSGHSTYYEINIINNTATVETYTTNQTSTYVLYPGDKRVNVATLYINGTGHCTGKSSSSSAVSFPSAPKPTLIQSSDGSQITLRLIGGSGSTNHVIICEGNDVKIYSDKPRDFIFKMIDHIKMFGGTVTCKADYQATHIGANMSSNTVTLPSLNMPSTGYTPRITVGGSLGGEVVWRISPIPNSTPQTEYIMEVKHEHDESPINDGWFTLGVTSLNTQNTAQSAQVRFDTTGMERMGDMSFRAYYTWWNGTHIVESNKSNVVTLRSSYDTNVQRLALSQLTLNIGSIEYLYNNGTVISIDDDTNGYVNADHTRIHYVISGFDTSNYPHSVYALQIRYDGTSKPYTEAYIDHDDMRGDTTLIYRQLDVGDQIRVILYEIGEPKESAWVDAPLMKLEINNVRYVYDNGTVIPRGSADYENANHTRIGYTITSFDTSKYPAVYSLWVRDDGTGDARQVANNISRNNLDGEITLRNDKLEAGDEIKVSLVGVGERKDSSWVRVP